MKIVCDSCQAKYSIADEKVQGKAFKIRCKKCNHIIVVKSAPAESAPAAAAEPQAAPAAVEALAAWHIVVEGEQVGPLSEADINGRLSRSEISGDTLVWKEGFADWVKLSTVPEFAEASGAATGAQDPAQSASTPPPRSAPAQEMPAAAPAPIADLFAAAAPAPSNPQADLFAAPGPGPVEAPAAASPFAFGGAAVESHQPSANPGNGAAHLTGQRNENSVLFSLSNLEALAVPNQSGAIRPPSSSTTTEGSGLIDIRSMAAMTVGGASGGDSHSTSAESLPTFSTPQFSALPAVLQAAPSSGPPKWLYPALGVVGLAVIGLGFGIYKVVSTPTPPPVVVAVAPTQPAVPPATAPVAPSAEKPPVVPAATPSAAPGDEKPVPDKTVATAEKADKAEKGDRKGKPSKPTASKQPAASAKPAPTAPAPAVAKPEPSKPEPSKPSKPSSIDDLLNQVGSAKKSDDDKPKKTAAAPAALTSLSQSDIVKAMQAVQPKVKACYDQYKVAGTALTNVSVAKGGRVAAVSVAGKFAGTPTGTCVEAAARTAKFPPCEAMNFPWPFQLR